MGLWRILTHGALSPVEEGAAGAASVSAGLPTLRGCVDRMHVERVCDRVYIERRVYIESEL